MRGGSKANQNHGASLGLKELSNMTLYVEAHQCSGTVHTKVLPFLSVGRRTNLAIVYSDLHMDHLH